MSLTVYLYEMPEEDGEFCCPYCDGTGKLKPESNMLYSRNITHNLGKMADEAGIYKALWCPEELEIERAGELVPILEKGLAELELSPEKFREYNSPNGWGVYENLVNFVSDYLAACKETPNAAIKISR